MTDELFTIFILPPLWSQFREIAVAVKMYQNIVGIKKKELFGSYYLSWYHVE